MVSCGTVWLIKVPGRDYDCLSPVASVCTNRMYYECFQVSRGTRQGCPLSPLLFALTIKTLEITLRQDTTMIGLFREELEQRILLYVDDMILYVSYPDISMPRVLSILQNFSKISGYNMNLQKSEMFPTNSLDCTYSFHTLPFKVTDDHFTYLGVQITNSIGRLFKENFNKLLTKIEQDLKCWMPLYLSPAGRIILTKMNVLPKHLDILISSFIWSNKSHRFSRAYLQRPKVLGGIFTCTIGLLILNLLSIGYFRVQVLMPPHGALLKLDPVPNPHCQH